MIELKKMQLEDLEQLMRLEHNAFPAAEAAKKETLAYRIRHYNWWICKAETDGKLIGYICARPVTGLEIEDAMYEPKSYPEGSTLAILSLATDPDWRKRGIGGFLMKDFIYLSREAHFLYLILACKEEKIPYYESFGFVEKGISNSNHGGAVWYDMQLSL